MKKGKHPKLNKITVIIGDGDNKITTSILGTSKDTMFLPDPQRVWGEGNSGSIKKHRDSLSAFDDL